MELILGCDLMCSVFERAHARLIRSVDETAAQLMQRFSSFLSVVKITNRRPIPSLQLTTQLTPTPPPPTTSAASPVHNNAEAVSCPPPLSTAAVVTQLVGLQINLLHTLRIVIAVTVLPVAVRTTPLPPTTPASTTPTTTSASASPSASAGIEVELGLKLERVQVLGWEEGDKHVDSLTSAPTTTTTTTTTPHSYSVSSADVDDAAQRSARSVSGVVCVATAKEPYALHTTAGAVVLDPLAADCDWGCPALLSPNSSVCVSLSAAPHSAVAVAAQRVSGGWRAPYIRSRSLAMREVSAAVTVAMHQFGVKAGDALGSLQAFLVGISSWGYLLCCSLKVGVLCLCMCRRGSAPTTICSLPPARCAVR
jgi:hypothetical protein